MTQIYFVIFVFVFQLTEAEKHGSLLTLDKKSLNKQLEGLNHENVKLKEEVGGKHHGD